MKKHPPAGNWHEFTEIKVNYTYLVKDWSSDDCKAPSYNFDRVLKMSLKLRVIKKHSCDSKGICKYMNKFSDLENALTNVQQNIKQHIFHCKYIFSTFEEL